MEPFDEKLLLELQVRFPLVRQPYAELATRLGCTERDVIDRVTALRQGGVIREISGIFDAQALGYRQALAAFRVPPALLEQAGQIVAAHPGVTHCYSRLGEYNLWFTLAISPLSTLGLEQTFHRLAHACRADAHMILPTLRRYKLELRFGGQDDGNDWFSRVAQPPSAVGPLTGQTALNSKLVAGPENVNAIAAPPAISDVQVRAIGALQDDLPDQADPFAPLAQAAGMSADDLLVHAADFMAAGWMRRYAAVLHHRAAGATTNVLVAWVVEHSQADAAGAAAGACSAVSHCYLRPTGPDWPFNLYTMIHGASRDQCRTAIEQVQAATGLSNHVELWTQTEFKKQRMKLFGEEERQWERKTIEEFPVWT